MHNCIAIKKKKTIIITTLTIIIINNEINKIKEKEDKTHIYNNKTYSNKFTIVY